MSFSPGSDPKIWLKEEARALGLDVLGITRPGDVQGLPQRLGAFLDRGFHGDMDWMAETANRRSDSRALWSDVRSIIMIGQSYAPESDPLAALAEKDRAVISVYAKGRDYHDVLKGRIKLLARRFAQESSTNVKIFVDTAPLMEKPLAAAAGLGWQGKHTNLVSRTHGSWLFLGAILTDADIAPDPPEANHCGSCHRCLDICPTRAFPAPYQLDARRCLAYLTIEHKGHIPREFREPLGNRVFGCDDCLAVCPWNKFAQASREARYKVQPATDNPTLRDLLQLDDPTFRARFAGTPVKRTGRNRVVRNALIAAGNSGDATLIAEIEPLLSDASELVRAMSVWACSRLCAPEKFEALREQFAPCETDTDVLAEWSAPAEGPP